MPSGATYRGGVPLRLFVEPADGYHSVRALIGSARRTIDLTMYEFDDRRIEDALAAAHRRGVRVRVLLDRAFRGATVNRAAFDRLTAAGVAVRWAPERLIVHQKTLTVDGDVSAVMTGNLTALDEPTTRDFVVVDRYPPAVSAIDGVFDADWSGGPTRRGPTPAGLVWSPGATPALVGLIDSARRSLTVENEEMSAPAIETALAAASRRGVRVEVVMSGAARGDAGLRTLSRAGIRVVISAASRHDLYLHAKAIVADGTTAFVGSQNFSTSSLDDNRELGIVTTDPPVVEGVARTLASDLDTASAGSVRAP